MQPQIFNDRIDAGKELAKKLSLHALGKTAVLALPRGGMRVGFQVAGYLGAPLDTIVVRKLRAAGDPEQGFGVIAPAGITLLKSEIVERLGLSSDDIRNAIEREARELEREISYFRSGEFIRGCDFGTLVIVADGFATGISARAAVESVRLAYKPKKIICAAPVCSAEAFALIREAADEVVSVLMPDYFLTVGQWYRRFNAISDDETLYLLQTHSARCEETAHTAPHKRRTHDTRTDRL